MARRKTTIIPLSRDHRRTPRWNTGLPPRPPRRGWRLADPRSYLGAAVVAAALGLIVLPAVSDAMIAVVKPAGESGQCRIYQVIDGDTVRIFCPGGGSTSARLTGFDAPELFSPGCPSEFRAALRAKWHLRLALWQADRLSLVREGSDRYDRALATLFLDGENVARRMIAEGHARPYAGGKRDGWCT